MARFLRDSKTGLYFSAETQVVVSDLATSRSATPTGVIYCHAHGGTAAEILDSRGFDYIKVMQGIAAGGNPVMSADLGGVDTWGNSTVISRITSAYTWLKANYGVSTTKLILVGTSMGFLAALNFAQANASLVKGVVGMFPVVDMQSSTITSNYQTQMNTAYTNNAGWLAALAASNPNTYKATLANVPIHLLYSTGDTIALPAAVTGFASGAVGATVTTQTLAAAADHVVCSMSAAEIATATSFVAAHA